MVFDFQKKRVEESAKEKQPDIPKWVSNENVTLKAWQYVEELKKEKALYIKRHHKITDYSTKKDYQIKGSDIAKALGINRQSLMNTSKHSANFRKYLDSVNENLTVAKEAQLKKSKGSPSRGSIRDSKPDLFSINTELRKRVDELEVQKTEELVRRAFDLLPLPIKRKLGID